MDTDAGRVVADPQESVYQGLYGGNEGHWAFGTDFADPLAGVDTTIAPEVDHKMLAAYCLMLGDDALIMAQQLAAWTARAPDLEEDVALSNIALDLLGQARVLLARAAAADGAVVPRLPEGSPVPAEDALAFFREANEFRNVRLLEEDNGDFAATLVRLVVFASWRLAILERLRTSKDRVLAAVAAKGVKELTYHRDYAARWVVTLAQGTPESRQRTAGALEHWWPQVGELFDAHPVERAMQAAAVGVDPSVVRAEFDAVLAEVLAAAELVAPNCPATGWSGRGGNHGAAMTRLLAQLQVVARAHPLGRW